MAIGSALYRGAAWIDPDLPWSKLQAKSLVARELLPRNPCSQEDDPFSHHLYKSRLGNRSPIAELAGRRT